VPDRRIFALADLHLSHSGEKPMDVFGEAWRDHARRMAEAWDGLVGGDDLVLLPGDLSWAKSLSDARADLEWIAKRPGRKLLLRGNHDSWWTSIGKVRAALPPTTVALHLDAHRFGDVVLVGARGWTLPGDPFARPEDESIFRREIGRLRLSLDDADGRFDRSLPRLAVTHYPPRVAGVANDEVPMLLRERGVGACVFGHLHGEDRVRAPRGTVEGIAYRLVAADAVDFTPVDVGPLLSG
jgi:hypothetical protein